MKKIIECEIESLETINEDKYAGFILFELFELEYSKQLEFFLSTQNQSLLAILLMRQGCHDEA